MVAERGYNPQNSVMAQHASNHQFFLGPITMAFLLRLHKQLVIWATTNPTNFYGRPEILTGPLSSQCKLQLELPPSCHLLAEATHPPIIDHDFGSNAFTVIHLHEFKVAEDHQPTTIYKAESFHIKRLDPVSI